jgi:hypothetical protein
MGIEFEWTTGDGNLQINTVNIISRYTHPDRKWQFIWFTLGIASSFAITTEIFVFQSYFGKIPDIVKLIAINGLLFENFYVINCILQYGPHLHETEITTHSQ